MTMSANDDFADLLGPPSPAKMLRVKDVLARFPISRPTLYRLIEKCAFPAPVRVGVRPAWPEDAIEAWVKANLASA